MAEIYKLYQRLTTDGNPRCGSCQLTSHCLIALVRDAGNATTAVLFCRLCQQIQSENMEYEINTITVNI